MLIGTFFPVPLLNALSLAFKDWAIILTAFALLVGLVNLLLVHLVRIFRRQEPGALYSIIVLVTSITVMLIGLVFGVADGPMSWIFDHVYLPLQGAFLALAAFFLATAAYRAMRARSFETLLMLIAALIVLLGQTPLVSLLADAKAWALSVPSTAGVRGILLGVALGTIATGLRLLIGMDRPYSE